MSVKTPPGIQAGLPPIGTPEARVLILGSFPGKKSLHVKEYYANPGNSFWRIMAKILGFPGGAAYAARVDILTQRRLALWDVLTACENTGSLDSGIRTSSAIANDFTGFLDDHPQVGRVCFNGQTAYKLFKQMVLPKLPVVLDYHVLPSTSSANTSLDLVTKTARWTEGVGRLD